MNLDWSEVLTGEIGNGGVTRNRRFCGVGGLGGGVGVQSRLRTFLLDKDRRRFHLVPFDSLLCLQALAIELH